MSGRCSPTEALNLLMPAFSPTAAAAKLTRAVHDERCQIIGNGRVIKSHIVPRLMVVAQRKRRRWRAHIVSIFAVGGVKPTNVWEFEIEQVKALLPQPQTIEDAATARKGSREQDLIREIAAERWPGGYERVETREIIKVVGDELKTRSLPVPKRDVFLRALGRRKG